MRGVMTGLVTAGLLLAAGCESKVPDRATVSGTVTYQGKPVTQGFVIVINKLVPTKQDQAPIRKDGTFEMTNAPLGDCKVVIQVNPAKPADPEAATKDKAALPEQPAVDKPVADKPPQEVLPAELSSKYANVDTTPLERTVKRDGNRFELEIK